MIKNIAWDFIGKVSVQFIGLAITIVLTRLLSPAEFGIMGMAMAVILVAHIFLDLGFNRAIIQYKEITETQYSTIFLLNAGAALLLTIACFFAADPLSRFYEQPLIKPVFRLLSVSFLLNGLNLVPASLLYKKLMLRLNGLIALISTVISGIIGICMAFNGYGVWSLVTQSLINSALLLVLNFICAGWYPSFSFSLSSIRPLWQYGSRLFASGLLDNVYMRLDTFIIGKLFTVSTLGYYSRAQSLDGFIRQFSVNSIMSALFPYIARHQDDRNFLSVLYIKYLHIICFVSIALSGTLFLISKYLFLLLFTAKWQYSAELFQLMCVIGFAWPVSSLMCNIIAGVGNSAAFLKLEVLKKIIVLPVYLFGFVFGLKIFIFCFIGATVVAVTLNAFFVSREIAVKVVDQLKIVMSYLVAGASAVVLSFYLYAATGFTNNVLSLVSLSLLFNSLYLLAAFLYKLEAFKSLGVLLKTFNTYLHDKRYKNIPAAL
ncbi:lipopolysaccharide biosynthesis protein [Hufsiella ginkgonis]|uniref:Oligosaccharide flippase family protein n=1 Tax=Hufsiella ginkgonis TaxID=2695274 RepID=A0A7K1Y0D3_9SPHI|nr:lipopolysaccharide biosynthesis protein [Hufsiella ginkgonis]MXV16690.1 oligosaccharide flippase family protein [Hufsiella ginkgonis]